MVSREMSALERTTPKILAPVANNVVAATAAAAAESPLENSIRGLQSKQKINELTLQEIKAKTAYQADRVDTTVKEMEQMAARVAKLEKTVENGFARIERLLAQGANFPGTPMGHFRGAAPNSSNYQRGRGFNPRGPRNIAPSLTGNVGFVNNRVQPTNFRMQEPGSQTPVQPSVISSPLSRGEGSYNGPSIIWTSTGLSQVSQKRGAKTESCLPFPRQNTCSVMSEFFCT